MNRVATVFAALLAVSMIGNAVLVLRGRPKGWLRSSSTPPGPDAPADNGHLPCAHEPEIARLRGEIASLKTRLAVAPGEKAVREATIMLQQEHERLGIFLGEQEGIAKTGRSDPQYVVNAINAAIEHLELSDGARTRFFDAVRLSLADVDRARLELEEIGRRVRQAGGTPPDDDEWMAANHRLHDRLRTVSRNAREVLDTTNPRQNGFAGSLERWVYLIARPFRD